MFTCVAGVTNYCDLCDEEKEVRIAPDRIRICENCEEKYPYNE